MSSNGVSSPSRCHVSTSAPTASRSPLVTDSAKTTDAELDVAITAARRDLKTRATSPASRSNARRAVAGIVNAVRHHDIVRRRDEQLRFHTMTRCDYVSSNLDASAAARDCRACSAGSSAIRGSICTPIVTMFDTGGSSGQLRDDLGVLPPGDVLKCALTLAQNEREARRLLLARLPMLTNGKTRGTHRRQSPPVDDGAVHGRRLPGCGRRTECAARLPRPRVADHRRARDAVRGAPRRVPHAGRGGR